MTLPNTMVKQPILLTDPRMQGVVELLSHHIPYIYHDLEGVGMYLVSGLPYPGAVSDDGILLRRCDFFQYSPNQQFFILLHEFFHILLSHLDVARKLYRSYTRFDIHLYNCITDAYINTGIVQLNKQLPGAPIGIEAFPDRNHTLSEFLSHIAKVSERKNRPLPRAIKKFMAAPNPAAMSSEDLYRIIHPFYHAKEMGEYQDMTGAELASYDFAEHISLQTEHSIPELNERIAAQNQARHYVKEAMPDLPFSIEHQVLDVGQSLGLIRGEISQAVAMQRVRALGRPSKRYLANRLRLPNLPWSADKRLTPYSPRVVIAIDGSTPSLDEIRHFLLVVTKYNDISQLNLELWMPRQGDFVVHRPKNNSRLKKLLSGLDDASFSSHVSYQQYLQALAEEDGAAPDLLIFYTDLLDGSPKLDPKCKTLWAVSSSALAWIDKPAFGRVVPVE